MSQDVEFHGETHTIPSPNERGWGAAVTAFLTSVGEHAISTVTTLAAELDLGASFGIRAAWFRSKSSNPAATGVGRLANTDKIAFRNAANSSDLPFGVDSSNNLEFNAVDVALVSGAQTLDAKTLTNSPSVAPAVLCFGAANTPNSVAGYFLHPWSSQAAAAGTAVEFRVPFACKVSNLYVQASAGPSGGTCTFRVYKNGGSAGIEATLAISGTQTADTTNTATFAAGDKIYVAAINNSGLTVGVTQPHATLRLTQA